MHMCKFLSLILVHINVLGICDVQSHVLAIYT